MKVIDVTERQALDRITVLSYGGMRAGKTRWAASFPRPLFLSDATEGGWTTISNMDRNAWFEPGVNPIVWSIEKAADMMAAIKDIDYYIKTKPGVILTVVVDSLTFYADTFFNAVDVALGGRSDQRQLYLKLAQHLKDLRIQVHQLPINVVWIALEKPPGEDNPVGSPMLSGQNAQKFAAGCDYVMYHRSYQPTPQHSLQWEIRTRRWQNYQAGGRDEGLLSDPIGYITTDENNKEVFVPDCTYRTMAEALGLPLSLPPIPPDARASIRPITATPPSIVPATPADSGNGRKVSTPSTASPPPRPAMPQPQPGRTPR
jgi:hypothetical protein